MYGKENAYNQKWMKELENASARFHISRLEALEIQTQQSLELMFGNQLDGIGGDIAGLDQRQIEKIISKPWEADGKNFSERV